MAWHFWPFRQRAPLRVGELNTGEFVLVDDTGHAQVIGIEASDVLRELARRPTSGEVIESLAVPAQASTSHLSDL
ncbi:MAG: hypothetical protein KIT35_21945 [Piscinibacter sp.]|uniref:hypothetical protein n=1 Tax=Piscinibacter sp. TaxID=1903157 RepID=UPI002585DC84|nr:hypothetical protein [Piscinibacter sp.]MCW5666503.1 hypothetical protein [Piscinibacter sp.]